MPPSSSPSSKEKKPSLSSLRFSSFYDRTQRRFKIGFVAVGCLTFLACLYTIVERLITDMSDLNPLTTSNRVRRRLRRDPELAAFFGAPLRVYDLAPSSVVTSNDEHVATSSRRPARTTPQFYVDAHGRRHIKITYGIHGSRVANGRLFVDAWFESSLDDDTETPSLYPQRIVYKLMVADAGGDPTTRTYLYENGVALSSIPREQKRSLLSLVFKNNKSK